MKLPPQSCILGLLLSTFKWADLQIAAYFASCWIKEWEKRLKILWVVTVHLQSSIVDNQITWIIKNRFFFLPVLQTLKKWLICPWESSQALCNVLSEQEGQSLTSQGDITYMFWNAVHDRSKRCWSQYISLFSFFFFKWSSRVVTHYKVGPSKHVSICIMLSLTVIDEREENKKQCMWWASRNVGEIGSPVAPLSSHLLDLFIRTRFIG